MSKKTQYREVGLLNCLGRYLTLHSGGLPIKTDSLASRHSGTQESQFTQSIFGGGESTDTVA